MKRRKKVVLFLPLRADPGRAEPCSADLLPLELLQIATGPAADGWEVVLIDAMIEPDYLAKVLEACDGALCFASSCILGYQVYDGYVVAKAVKERYPKLPVIWGGWFPSVTPEMYLRGGIADAVGIGQGELTFHEVVQALDSGTDLESVPGLALLRDDRIVYTAPRAVVGFDRIAPVPWHLLEYERYAALQATQGGGKVRHRMPPPRRWRERRPPRGFSYFSSFGCPTDCTFCCSPLVTGRRWKSVPGRELAEEIAELQQRFGFEALRFQDANWGVAEKRTRDFCAGLLDLGVELHWNATIEIETVMRYRDETIDLLRDTGCHLLWLGAESGTPEMQERIRKHIEIDNVARALGRLEARGILAGTFWIIGFPGESEESIGATLREAARVKRRFPGSASEVYPFRPLPGTVDWDAAIAEGWRSPRTFEEWGQCFEWKWNSQNTPLSRAVRRTWRRYTNTAALFDEHVAEGSPRVRRALARIAGWRLEHHEYRLPVEQKLFDWYVRASGQTSPGARS